MSAPDPIAAIKLKNITNVAIVCMKQANFWRPRASKYAVFASTILGQFLGFGILNCLLGDCGTPSSPCF